ncbi:hypothetical protein [Ferruginibacter sp.]
MKQVQSLLQVSILVMLNKLFFLVFVFSSLTGTAQIATKDIKYGNISFSAWNEDTVHPVQFLVLKEKYFSYSMVMDDSTKTKAGYHGTIALNPTRDTLFLHYYKHRTPAGFKNYLVKEASGNYLIQFFDSSTKRIFMRIQNLHLTYDF